MGAFAALIRSRLEDAGLPRQAISLDQDRPLPGWFRSQNQWNLLISFDGHLIGATAFWFESGQSSPPRYSYRAEGALASTADVWAAYREGVFPLPDRPWLGCLAVMADDDTQPISPTHRAEPAFGLFDEFRDASYAKRYELLLTKMVRERLYDSACLLLVDRTKALGGLYREPSIELSFQSFVTPLLAKAVAVAAVSPRTR